MSEVQYVKVRNDCEGTIKVYRRHLKRKKPLPLGPITLRPAHETPPLPYHSLVGAKDWNSLRSRECVKIINVPYESRFVQLRNISNESVIVEVKPAVEAPRREITKITLGPDASSRAVDLKSIARPELLKRMIAKKQMTIEPVYEIGPSTGRKGAAASYAGESVYICDRCGGPIIFRGSPPRPIHI